MGENLVNNLKSNLEISQLEYKSTHFLFSTDSKNPEVTNGSQRLSI